jgi:hypothetical protein
MEKPVIILGGGYLGTLLALRLREARPEVPFVLYEESSSLGGERSETFFDNHLSPWMKPLISKSWNEFKVGEPIEAILGQWHYIDGHFFHQYAQSVLGKRVQLNKMPTPESALKESAFVIDTRNNGHYPKTIFQADISLELVLINEHGLSEPMLDQFDQQSGAQKMFSLYPLGPRRLFVKHHQVFSVSRPIWEEMRQHLLTYLHQKGWKVSRVLKEDRHINELPLSIVVTRTAGRYISLSGLLHGPRGSTIPRIADLIEKITSNSFRLGEVQRVVKECREEYEDIVRLYFAINRFTEVGEGPAFYQWLKSQRPALMERYFSVKLSRFDKVRMSAWFLLQKMKSHVKKPALENDSKFQCQFSE